MIQGGDSGRAAVSDGMVRADLSHKGDIASEMGRR